MLKRFVSTYFSVFTFAHSLSIAYSVHKSGLCVLLSCWLLALVTAVTLLPTITPAPISGVPVVWVHPAVAVGTERCSVGSEDYQDSSS
jgi:hypothetical protein